MRHTALHGGHVKLGATMVDFAGWEMPLHYPGGIISEHLATRKYGGLFDVSHMGRFTVDGADAIPFLQHVLSNNAAALETGQAQYTIIPTESGGAIDDAFLYRTGADEFLLVVNAANAEADMSWLRQYAAAFPKLRLHDGTEETAMVALQGPRSKAVLERLFGSQIDNMMPLRNRLMVASIYDTEVVIARTGYTGEPVCFELFPPVDKAARLWDELLAAAEGEGIVPVGLAARDTLRLEAGLPLYGHELGSDSAGKEIPVLALPVARLAVSFAEAKGDYIGRAALREQFEELKLRQVGLTGKPDAAWKVPREIKHLLVSGGGVARAGCEVFAGSAPAGYVTSGTMVPCWQFEGQGATAVPGQKWERRAIALAYMDIGLKTGQEVDIKIRDRTVKGVIVERHLGNEAAPYARPLPPAPKRDVDMNIHGSLGNLARELFLKTGENTGWRQRRTINLIPSEQTPSSLVRLLTIADPSGRYAEHRVLKSLKGAEVYYYQGTDFISWVESELAGQLRKYLDCFRVETRPISGQLANMTVYSGYADYLNRLDRRSEPRRLKMVMNHHIGRGGHLSAQPMGGLRDYVSISPVTERWAVVNFPLDPDDPYQIDLAGTEELINRFQPELIIMGRSLILYREPVAEIARMVSGLKPKPLLLYDGAHVLGLLGPHYQRPLQEGAGLVTGSTHKTFFGTQRGIIAGNMAEESDEFALWESIFRRSFPGSVSNHHLGTLLGLLMASYEMNTCGREYQKQVIANARAFAAALSGQGIRVEGSPQKGFTETHQVVVRVGYAGGMEIARRLEENNIIVNYQALHDDEAFSASSGLRMGVQEMTRFGMKEGDFGRLAEMMAQVIEGGDIGGQAAEFRSAFTEMRYCLPEDEAGPLLDELIGCILGKNRR